ncbi:hypothetical protein [Alterisphingorhabdus coralli]|uniref:Cytochrome c domain-containing protein n=1 Tax=Alterisphingorhabdus coralli TaxID=3071408 RepID=A0AA97F6T4_9SPHN|nr:hypothetical protein [Parasphingorhabdus sp. SCSIO 66989]WOE75001.1 hypothetical protein RB602_14370 [Parasphingorhabdus sp. SCSIO 66989]
MGGAALLLAATDALPLRAMQWLKVDGGPDAMVAAVNYDPGVCLAANASQNALTGEILFRTPSLLGGQAAKAGLSCASCHVNGGDNPNFHFPNASGAPGTADVSNSFFSATGGNGTFDPVSIPNLAEPGKVSRADPGELEAFLKTLIVVEFAGEEPHPAALSALADYIRALRSCEVQGESGRSLAGDLALVERAALMAERRMAERDEDMARLLVAGARDTLGRIYERFAGDDLRKERNSIEHSSITLHAASRETGSSNRIASFAVWRETFHGLRQILQRREDESLYNVQRLRERLE